MKMPNADFDLLCGIRKTQLTLTRIFGILNYKSKIASIEYLFGGTHVNTAQV